MSLNRSTITTVSLVEIQRNAENPREIDEAGKAMLFASLQRFGMVDVLILNREAPGVLRLLSGHQRLDALLANGATETAAMIVEVDPTEAIELGLMLNGHHGQWDQVLLEGILRDLARAGEDLSTLPMQGVKAYESALAALQAQTEEDEHAITVGNAHDPTTLELSDTKIIFGEEQIPIDRDRYLAWRDRLRSDGFFNESDATKEIKRKLLA